MGSDGMRYDLVKDIENYLGIRLENPDIISKLRKLSESKIEYLDGFHISTEDSNKIDNYQEYPFELVFKSKNGKKYNVWIDFANDKGILDVVEMPAYVQVNEYKDYTDRFGSPHNGFRVTIDDMGQVVRFVDGNNVIKIANSNESSLYVVSLYINTADIDYSFGLIPDDKFTVLYDIDKFGFCKLSNADNDKEICKLPVIMGSENVLHIMWRIGKTINELYMQSIKEQLPKQLVRTEK